MRRLVEHFVRGRPRASADLARLTEREREVLVLMARGLSNAAIARTLVIAETTAKTHVTRILAKLGLRDRAHAVVYGYDRLSPARRARRQNQGHLRQTRK
jgi:DNA-binding NarL/FixJ family response regulator